MQRTQWNRRLLSSTRGRILALLRTGAHTVNDLATALGLTDNAIRAHLLSLERDGLIQQAGTRPGRRKPHAAYKLSLEAEHIFPKAYGPLLNHLLTVVSKRLSARELRTSMHDVGRALAADHLQRLKTRSRSERIDAALKLYDDLGGSATVTRSDGKQRIHGRNGCPLAAVTANHPEACVILQSFLSKIIGTRVKICCQYGDSPHCCFELER